jgi:hypothetical protein
MHTLLRLATQATDRLVTVSGDRGDICRFVSSRAAISIRKQNPGGMPQFMKQSLALEAWRTRLKAVYGPASIKEPPIVIDGD